VHLDPIHKVWHATNYADNTTWHPLGEHASSVPIDPCPYTTFFNACHSPHPDPTYHHISVGSHPLGVASGQSKQWPVSVEDPYVWTDGAGVYHALAHAFTPFYGVHAFVRPEDVPSNCRY
jgi:hypothetical protein